MTNTYVTNEEDGQIKYYINGKKLAHGDAMVVGADGRLEVVKQKDLAKYIADRNITDAIVTVNGKENTGIDAAMMLQGSAATINDQVAQTGRPVAQIHIFNDMQVAPTPTGNNTIGLQKPDVQNSLQILINSGAFSSGGSIIGHSEGAFNISAVIGRLDSKDYINASIYLFGGAHSFSYPDRVNGWNDFYNPNDRVIQGAHVGTESRNAMNPEVIRDEPNKKSTYIKFINGQNTVWGSSSVPAGGAGSFLNHSFLFNYQDALRRNYKLNRGR
ncbi:hypothetical protein P3G55_04495 [Leptospira sp. 96542]|nr:hypothetical protein [Leptospira sp. 96542]